METHFYLSLLPEALIVSMLSPEEFGTYYAVGSSKKSRDKPCFLKWTRIIEILIFIWMKR